MRVLTDVPEIDALESELARPTPPLVSALDQVASDVAEIQISVRTRGLEQLAERSALRRIIARGVGDRELEFIGRARSLEHVDLADPKSPNLTALQKLSRLRLLSIANTARLVSLDGIEHLSRLELLSVANASRLSSIDAIASLRRLRVLFLAGGMYRSMRIASLRPLSGLTELCKLVLSNVGVADRSIIPLADLKKLRRLSLPKYFAAEEFAVLERELPSLTLS